MNANWYASSSSALSERTAEASTFKQNPSQYTRSGLYMSHTPIAEKRTVFAL